MARLTGQAKAVAMPKMRSRLLNHMNQHHGDRYHGDMAEIHTTDELRWRHVAAHYPMNISGTNEHRHYHPGFEFGPKAKVEQVLPMKLGRPTRQSRGK